MMPKEYVAELRRLLHARDARAIVDLAHRHHAQMASHLSLQECNDVHVITKWAALASRPYVETLNGSSVEDTTNAA